MNYEAIIESDSVTLEDCVDLYEKKGITIKGLEKPKSDIHEGE